MRAPESHKADKADTPPSPRLEPPSTAELCRRAGESRPTSGRRSTGSTSRDSLPWRPTSESRERGW